MKQLFKRLTGRFLALVLLLSSMPQSLTAIENCAFDGCASLNGLQFPAQLTSVGVSATGFLPMVAHYAFRPDAAVDRMQLRFSLPTQPELQTTSITLDGVTAGGGRSPCI